MRWAQPMQWPQRMRWPKPMQWPQPNAHGVATWHGVASSSWVATTPRLIGTHGLFFLRQRRVCTCVCIVLDACGEHCIAMRPETRKNGKRWPPLKWSQRAGQQPA